MTKTASRLLSRPSTSCGLACLCFLCGVLSFPPSAIAERLYSSGFELNSLTNGVEFAVPVPTGLSISSSTVRSGSYSLRQNSLTAGYIEHQWLAANADAHVFIRFYFRVAAVPSVTARVLDIVDTSGATRASLRLTSTGTLQLFNAAAQVGPDSSALVKDLWHCVEMEFQSLNAAGYDVLQARLDGTSFAASLKETLGTVAKLRLGSTVAITGGTPDFHFDDVAINDQNGVGENEFPGLGKIVVLMPNAAGDSASGESGPTPGKAGWEMVNEVPPDDASGYWRLTGTNDKLSVNIADAATITKDDRIKLVQVGARVAAASGSSCSYSVGIKSQASGDQVNSSTTTIADATFSTHNATVPRNYKLAVYADPQSTNPWTADRLNTTQIVVQSPDAKPEVHVTSLWALVEYVPPSMVSAIANDHSAQGRGIQTGDRVVITLDTRTNGYNITSSNVDAVLRLSNSHSWLDGSGHFGGASWGSTKCPNDTLLITLSNASGTAPSVAVGDYISIGANTIEVTTGGEDLTGSPVKITGTFTGPWYYHVNSAAAPSNVGTAYQNYSTPFPAPSVCWHNISDALKAVKTDAHEGPWVIQVDDTATYDDAVTIADFRTNASATLTIRKNPALSGRPTVYPTAAGKRAFNIGGDGQKDGNNSYVTIQGFAMSNNATGTDTTTENCLFIINENNQAMGQMIVEDCVFDGLGQTYDVRNTVAIYFFHVDSIFRNNEVKNFRDTESGTGWLKGLLVLGPEASSIVGGQKLQIISNSFHDNTGQLIEFKGNQANNWMYSSLFEGNKVYNNRGILSLSIVAFENLNLSNTIRNNFFYDNSLQNLEDVRGVLDFAYSHNSRIYHNTFYGNKQKQNIYVAGSSTYGVEIKNNLICPFPGPNYAINVGSGAEASLIVKNNAFYADFSANGYPPGFGFSMTENTETVALYGRTAKTTSTFNGANANISGNGYTLEGPGLDRSMHLVAGSLCIDRGVPGLVSDDMDGEHRPMGAGYDIGADEYGTASTARSLGGDQEPQLEGQQSVQGAPIHFAAYMGDLARIEAYIQEGGDVNKLDGHGHAPLHYAAQNNQKQAMELLIAKGGGVNVKNSRGQTPLFNAIAAGNRDVAELLISKGADVNVKNSNGQTPLDSALSRNRKDIVELLIAKDAEGSILTAVSCGDVDRVRGCLEKGADVNAKDTDGRTALHVAVGNERKDVAELLLSRGADINAKDGKGYTPLYYAIWNEDQDTVKLLVTKGADVSYTPRDDYPPLFIAVAIKDVNTKDVNTVKLLVDHGAKFDVKTQFGWTAFRLAASQGNRDLVEIFASKGTDVSTLPLAACVGNLARVKSLVEQGADPNAKDEFGWTPLYWAASTGQEEVAAYLIGKGATVDAKTIDERTPLHQAAQAGAAHLVELLISKGLDVNVKDKRGNTPLHGAAAAGRREVAELLIAKGADINAKTTNEHWTTPLHSAAFAGHKEMVELLIARGADANIRNYRGHTALDLAEQRGHTEIAEVLRKHGAKE
ncbi:MAG: ankyrin repeat domain-containing protein [Phycisphaerae bacterium]|nr:ankyrin repeat domain-containing protein [Phycisphaerae bacterium]